MCVCVNLVHTLDANGLSPLSICLLSPSDPVMTYLSHDIGRNGLINWNVHVCQHVKLSIKISPTDLSPAQEILLRLSVISHLTCFYHLSPLHGSIVSLMYDVD